MWGYAHLTLLIVFWKKEEAYWLPTINKMDNTCVTKNKKENRKISSLHLTTDISSNCLTSSLLPQSQSFLYWVNFGKTQQYSHVYIMRQWKLSTLLIIRAHLRGRGSTREKNGYYQWCIIIVIAKPQWRYGHKERTYLRERVRRAENR